MDTEGDGESSAIMPPDGELSEQDQVWLDAEHVKMTVQKGLLYFHLEQHKEFLDTGTCVSCALSSTDLTHTAHDTHKSCRLCWHLVGAAATLPKRLRGRGRGRRPRAASAAGDEGVPNQQRYRFSRRRTKPAAVTIRARTCSNSAPAGARAQRALLPQPPTRALAPARHQPTQQLVVKKKLCPSPR
jgi:hypothetical protein